MIPRERVRRVLIRCPNWLGDTVMAIPALRALRATLPAAELWGLGPWVTTVLEAEPALDRRLPYPEGLRARWALARDLAAAGVDVALLLPNSFESALHAWLTGARWRIGYAGDGRAGLLTHALRPPAAAMPQVEEYLGLLAPLGLPRDPAVPAIAVSESRRAEARRLLADAGLRPGEPLVGIQLGAALGPSKLWPGERLAALAAVLDAEGTPVVFLGRRSAAPLLGAVKAAGAPAARSLVGRDHPALLAAVLAELAVLVAPDSGPAHVAAAVGTPVVALFGPTDPRRTAPAGESHTVLWRRPPCAPCFRPECPIDHRCLHAITVEEVAASVRERLLHRGTPAAR